MNQNFRFKPAEIGAFKHKLSDLAVVNFAPECRILGLTNGHFSLIDLIYSVLKKTGKARVIVATWSAGIKDIYQVQWMMQTDLISDFKLLTDHSYTSRKSNYVASIEDIFGVQNIRTSEMHAKFVLIENDKYKVAIRSSMNLNANKTCELFEIDEGPDIYDFLMSYVSHTFDNMEPGFVEESAKVSACVAAFFNKTENLKSSQPVQSSAPARNWWEINNKTE